MTTTRLDDNGWKELREKVRRVNDDSNNRPR